MCRTRVVAIDWSGRAKLSHKYIWLAEAVDGELVGLACGRSRDEIGDWLIAEQRKGRPMIVGLDFAFSLPAWFMAEKEFTSAHSLWAATDSQEPVGENWLSDCQPPFWGRPARRRPEGLIEWRRTEVTCREMDLRPRSVFQVGGAGAVGTGSLRGMPLLHRLTAAGFSVWPFDDPALPMVVEIYPRALTGPVTKSCRPCRERYLQSCYPALNDEWKATAASSEDAFDAAVSALQMARHVKALEQLPVINDPTLRLEGLIWHPNLLASQTAATATPSASPTFPPCSAHGSG